MDVFLLWDNTRAEHGEGMTLIEVYATEQRAKEGQQWRTDYSDIDQDELTATEIDELVEEASNDQFPIEKREVKE